MKFTATDSLGHRAEIWAEMVNGVPIWKYSTFYTDGSGGEHDWHPRKGNGESITIPNAQLQTGNGSIQKGLTRS